MSINGVYDAFHYRLWLEKNDESSGKFSGRFIDARPGGAEEKVTGWFNFYPERDETELTFSTSTDSWKWQGRRYNYDTWDSWRTPKSNPKDVESLKFYRDEDES
jgi:hypothetical protein